MYMPHALSLSFRTSYVCKDGDIKLQVVPINDASARAIAVNDGTNMLGNTTHRGHSYQHVRRRVETLPITSQLATTQDMNVNVDPERAKPPVAGNVAKKKKASGSSRER